MDTLADYVQYMDGTQTSSYSYSNTLLQQHDPAERL